MIFNKANLEKLYNNPNLIWDRDTPPDSLIKVIKDYSIKPCKTLEIGCGKGLDARYLSSLGFDVLAIDLTIKAIEKIADTALAYTTSPEGKLTFKSADFFTEVFVDTFDFIYDYGFWHLYSDEENNPYEIPKKIYSLLNENGIWFSSVAKYGGNEELNEYRRKNSFGDLRGYTQEEIVTFTQGYFDILEIFETENVVKHSVINKPLNMWSVVFRKKK